MNSAVRVAGMHVNECKAQVVARRWRQRRQRRQGMNWARGLAILAAAALSICIPMLRACAAGRGGRWSGVGQRAARTCRSSIAIRCVHTPGTPESHPRARRAMEVSQQPAALVPQAERAWAWFEEMGAPKYWVRSP